MNRSLASDAAWSCSGDKRKGDSTAKVLNSARDEVCRAEATQIMVWGVERQAHCGCESMVLQNDCWFMNLMDFG